MTCVQEAKKNPKGVEKRKQAGALRSSFETLHTHTPGDSCSEEVGAEHAGRSVAVESSLQDEVDQERSGFTVTAPDQLEGDPCLILAGVFESRGVEQQQKKIPQKPILDSDISVELFQYEAKP